jgi:putative ABC transport system ATP-binding protein
MQKIIVTKNISKIYNSGEIAVKALSEVSVTVSEGDFVAIMGASGSGKSTFLNIIGCLDQPTEGDYLLDSVNVKGLDKNQLAEIRNRKIGFVFQSFNLLSRTTALENVELPLFYNHIISGKQRKEKGMEALHMVGLSDRAKHYSNQMSGGQQQRVAIARALINEPKLILADEPTGNLDSKTSIEVMDLFCRLNEQGITIVLVTHENDIAAYTKRNITFRDGRIQKNIEVTNRKNAAEEMKYLKENTKES